MPLFNFASGLDSTLRLDRILDTQGDGTGTIEQNVAGKTITGATNATPIVVTATAHGYSDGDYVWIDSVGGNTNANGLHVVANKADNTFALNTPGGANVAGNGNYTSGGDSHLAFLVKPPAGQVFYIERMNLVAGDTAAVAVEQYVGIAKLTNGIVVQVRQDTTLIHTMTSTPIRAWNDWSLQAGVDTPLLDLSGNNTDAAVRWTFGRTSPAIRLDGDYNEFLVLLVQDDLDGLTYQRVAVQGRTTDDE